MSEGGDSERRLGGPERRVDGLAMGQFVGALRRGASVQAAAVEVGFGLTCLYRARRQDAAWAAALAAPERAAGLRGGMAPG